MSNESSDSLKRNIPKILSTWEAEAYKSVLSSYGVTSLVLTNAIQSFLKNVADALSTSIDRTPGRAVQDNANIINFAKVHGGGRATAPLHYTLAEVILEFQILQRVIFDVLEEEATVTKEDRKIVMLAIDKALSHAATQFAEVHGQIQEQYALTLVHDLRSPISVAKMGAQIIKKDAASSKDTLMLAAKIDKNMDRVELMLRELLDASRTRAGMGLVFSFEEVRLDILAKDVVKEMTETHGNKFELHADEPVLGTWNTAGLRRVLENLIVNAIKYGDISKKVRIALSQNATDATLIVHNEGHPIPFEVQPKLFEQFIRRETTANTPGWGLGLALVHGMVKAHRGTVRIESSQKTGTDFIVDLPKKQ